MSGAGCPHPLKLLQLVSDGEYVPHLRTCEKCRDFVAAAKDAVETFNDQHELLSAVREEIDARIGDVPSHRWRSVIFGERALYRSVVVRDLLRRADELGGSRPRDALQFSEAAVDICDAMTASGTPPAPELRFDALKSHSSWLREMHLLDAALAALARAWPLIEEMEAPEPYRATLSLCAAIIYAEPDLANFDEAIRLAHTAAAVLDISGDSRRAVIARHTEAYAYAAMNRFAEAVPLLRGVIEEIGEAGGSTRDTAFAHALLGMSLVRVGAYEEGLDHVRIAEHLHMQCGDVVDAARAAHFVASAKAGLGCFAEVREDFTRAADVVFRAELFDVWCLLRLDFIAAALEDDEAADVRADVEMVARVAMTMAKDSTQRRRFFAEACDYLRRLAIRDAIPGPSRVSRTAS